MNIYSLSKGIARKFLKDHKLSSPLSIEKTLTIIEVKLVYTYLSRIGAFLVHSKKRGKLIAINNNYDLTLQRFFIAHEIGHVILGHQGIYIDTLSIKSKTYWEDKLADACARELLMPGHELREIACIYKYDVQILKDYFMVPELEMVIRLRETGLPYWNTVYKNF